jgi:hypothetical protein
MLKYGYLIAASYNLYIGNMFNSFIFLILTCITLLFEIKDLLTEKKEGEKNGNN